MTGPERLVSAIPSRLPNRRGRFPMRFTWKSCRHSPMRLLQESPHLTPGRLRMRQTCFRQEPRWAALVPKLVVESSGELWLAKFAHRDDRWNHPRVEHGLLTLAKACGIRVADSRVETIGSRDVLLVRRFDRQRADGGFFRHRMVSALTLLRSDSSEAGRQRWSYLLLAD